MIFPAQKITPVVYIEMTAFLFTLWPASSVLILLHLERFKKHSFVELHCTSSIKKQFEMTWFRLLVWACSVASSLALGLPNRKLVLVVLDGFSPHYLLNESYPTPHLQSLINKPVEGGFRGTLVRGVRPEFPASKLPFISAVANGRHSLENRVRITT